MKHKKREKGWLRHVSIKWRIFAILVAFVAFILAMLWIFQTALLNPFYQRIKINEIQAGAEEIRRNLNNPQLLVEGIQNMALEKQTCVIISDEAGYVYIDSEASPNCIIHKLRAQDLVYLYYLVQKNGGSYLGRGIQINGQEPEGMEVESHPGMILYASISQLEDGSNRLVLLNASLIPVNATVQTLQTQLLWITGFLLLIALGIGIVLDRWISKPIIKINESAKKLATGNYDIHFAEEGYGEIVELAKTLNYAAQELSKVEGLQRELVANISHDLRTPLTMIIGYSEAMRDIPGENTPENIQVVIDEAKRLNTLVNDVLDISKLQSGTQTLSLKEFNLTRSIQEILLRYNKLVDYDIRFQFTEEIWVRADELKISQVVYNLVNNAITYTGRDKKVTIIQSLPSARPGYVQVEVQDTGEGLEQNQLQDIWQRYYKVDKSHKRAQIGTGLGLSIVKTILDMHTGAVYGVHSILGKGSTFWFALPQISPPLPAPSDGTSTEKGL